MMRENLKACNISFGVRCLTNSSLSLSVHETALRWKQDRERKLKTNVHILAYHVTDYIQRRKFNRIINKSPFKGFFSYCFSSPVDLATYTYKDLF